MFWRSFLRFYERHSWIVKTRPSIYSLVKINSCWKWYIIFTKRIYGEKSYCKYFLCWTYYQNRYGIWNFMLGRQSHNGFFTNKLKLELNLLFINGFYIYFWFTINILWIMVMRFDPKSKFWFIQTCFLTIKSSIILSDLLFLSQFLGVSWKFYFSLWDLGYYVSLVYKQNTLEFGVEVIDECL